MKLDMKKKILLLITGLLIIGVIYIIISQSYPVVSVNWHLVSAKSFNNDFNTAIFYYQKAAETYNKSQATAIDSPQARQEIERAVLDKSVENILIINELEKRLKNSEIDQMVQNKINEVFNGQDIAKQVATIYNLSLNEFKERVLTPEALLEILQARFALENQNFDDWLKSAKKQAKVIILIPGFGWNGQGTVTK